VTAEQIIGLIVALLVMFCGAIGSVVPILPGTPIIFIAAVLHRLYFGAAGANNWVLLGLLLLTVISFLFDYLSGTYGAKKLGATWRGMLGAIIGGLVGLFFSLPGIILGPFIGAMLFELLGGSKFKHAARAGLGAFLGLIAGAIGKFAICVVMIGLFTLNVVFRSVG
jgi:uncharacterized protein YqgC (DUF456 family)